MSSESGYVHEKRAIAEAFWEACTEKPLPLTKTEALAARIKWQRLAEQDVVARVSQSYSGLLEGDTKRAIRELRLEQYIKTAGDVREESRFRTKPSWLIVAEGHVRRDQKTTRRVVPSTEILETSLFSRAEGVRLAEGYALQPSIYRGWNNIGKLLALGDRSDDSLLPTPSLWEFLFEPQSLEVEDDVDAIASPDVVDTKYTIDSSELLFDDDFEDWLWFNGGSYKGLDKDFVRILRLASESHPRRVTLTDVGVTKSYKSKIAPGVPSELTDRLDVRRGRHKNGILYIPLEKTNGSEQELEF